MNKESPMSKKSNVNPDHYKTAGRTRQGEATVQEIQTQKYTQSRQNATVHAPAAAAKVNQKGKAAQTIRKAQSASASRAKNAE
jgi:hypothetical protein